MIQYKMTLSLLVSFISKLYNIIFMDNYQKFKYLDLENSNILKCYQGHIKLEILLKSVFIQAEFWEISKLSFLKKNHKNDN